MGSIRNLENYFVRCPESILVILGAIALYDFTKETSPKDASI